MSITNVELNVISKETIRNTMEFLRSKTSKFLAYEAALQREIDSIRSSISETELKELEEINFEKWERSYNELENELVSEFEKQEEFNKRILFELFDVLGVLDNRAVDEVLRKIAPNRERRQRTLKDIASNNLGFFIRS